MPHLVALLLAVSLAPAGETPLPANWGGRPGTTIRLPLAAGQARALRGVWTPGSWPSRVVKGVLELDLPADAATGFVPVRPRTPRGLGELRLVSVDPYPEVATPGAATSAGAPLLAVPCVAVGTVEAEAVRRFRVPVKKGVPLVLDAFGRRLGSPLDPTLTLTAPGGQYLPGAFADDTPGLAGDARVVYTAPADGFVVVELRDSTFQGGPGHAFRLRVGTRVPAIGVTPAALGRGQSATLTPVAPDRAPQRESPTPPRDEHAAAFALGDGDAWPAFVRAADEPQSSEVEPNDTPGAAQPLLAPGGVTAGFHAARDRDHFTFVAQAGEAWAVAARAAEIGSPCEVLLKVLDAAGAELARSDPAKPLADAAVTAKVGGPLTVVCESLNGVAGPRERYWLTLRRAEADFALALPDPRVAVTAGAANLLAVDVTRNAATGPLAITASGELAGELAVPAGVTGRVWLPVRAAVGATPGPGVLGVRGRAAGATRVAEAASVAGLPVPPEWAATVAREVTRGPAADLRVLPVFFSVKPDGKFTLTTTLGRHDGVKSPLALAVEGPFRVAGSATVGPGRSGVALAADAKAAPGLTSLGWRLVGGDGRVVAAGAEWVTVAKSP